MSPRTPLALSCLLAACGMFQAGDAGTADTTAAAAAATAAEMLELPEEPVELLSPPIRAACALAARYWQAHPGASLSRFDSTVTVPRGPRADACWVMVRLDEDRDRDQEEVRAPFRAAGWLPIYEFDADGKDGRSRVFQLDPVRCLVTERWDGGVDGDTTYLPRPWFEQATACFRR